MSTRRVLGIHLDQPAGDGTQGGVDALHGYLDNVGRDVASDDVRKSSGLGWMPDPERSSESLPVSRRRLDAHDGRLS